MFSWSEKDKEYYYKKAQKVIDEAIPEGKGRILVDRHSFGVKGGKVAVVFIQALSVTCDKKLINKLLKLKGFEELKTTTKHGKLSRGYIFKGSIEVKLRKKDR